MITTKEIINQLRNLRVETRSATYAYPLPVPAYTGTVERAWPKIGMAVESMKRHTTDEGWQIFAGLESAGYVLTGHNLRYPLTDTVEILEKSSPAIVVVQDKREWDVRPHDFRDPRARFTNVSALASRNDIFRLTVVKDAQHSDLYHAESAVEIGAHGWVVYYHPDIVAYLAPYVRRDHLVRTYHSLDAATVPDFVPARERGDAILSGAVSNAYPLRSRLISGLSQLHGVTVLPHPGYRIGKCYTPEYLTTLSKFKVAIATASRFGYALRKIIEATAAGCVVITDLPADDVLPEIDANLIRVHPGSSLAMIDDTIRYAVSRYDVERQHEFANRAVTYYNYQAVGYRLAVDIEDLRERFVPGRNTAEGKSNVH